MKAMRRSVKMDRHSRCYLLSLCASIASRDKERERERMSQHVLPCMEVDGQRGTALYCGGGWKRTKGGWVTLDVCLFPQAASHRGIKRTRQSLRLEASLLKESSVALVTRDLHLFPSLLPSPLSL